MSPIDYRSAGVDLDVYEESMSRLPRLMRRTFSPRVLPLPGGFAGLFQLDFDGDLFRRNYRDPVLVSCCDGVGTKIQVAKAAGRHDTVGIDLVAMSVNDLLCLGAEPLFFLDYVVMGQDDPALLEAIVKGVSDGCVTADVALLGGETAIHPGHFEPGDYDLSGFCVGVAEKRRLITGRSISPGDVVIGAASSGVHSNGFSLARKIVFDHAGLSVADTVDELGGRTVGDVLLTPTRIYAAAVRKVLRHYRIKQVVHGIAHITGGGLAENLERIVPPKIDLVLDRAAWTVPPVFTWMRRLADVDPAEMDRVFNMGVGLVLVVSPFYAPKVREHFASCEIETFVLGTATVGTGHVCWRDEPA